MAARLKNAFFARSSGSYTTLISTRDLGLRLASPASSLRQQVLRQRQPILHPAGNIRMASSTSAPRTHEWLVVIPDKPGVLAKRIEVRPQHFEGLTKAKESGLFKMGGAILDDVPVDDEVSSLKFAGSTVIVVAESREAVVNALKDDVYFKSGVWDLEKAQIWPTKFAFRFP